jgi:hypothetical protein
MSAEILFGGNIMNFIEIFKNVCYNIFIYKDISQEKSIHTQRKKGTKNG